LNATGGRLDEKPGPTDRASLLHERGIPLRVFVAEAVRDKLNANAKPEDKPWMAAFGKLRHLRQETTRINRIIEDEFEKIELEDSL